MKRIIIISLSAILLASCTLDPFGILFGSSADVDTRFEQSVALGEVSPPTITNSNFTFIMLADTHVYQQSNQFLSRLSNGVIPGDSFLLVTGDLVQSGQKEDFEALRVFFTNSRIPGYGVPGNHDLYLNGWQYYPDIVGRSSYSFTAGSLRVVGLDSASGTLGNKQMVWLENTLASNTHPLLLVFTHFEIFSENILETQQYTDIEEIYYLMALFERYNVDYVCMGHSHAFSDRVINGVRYIIQDAFTDRGATTRKFIRVSVSNQSMSYQRLDFE